MSFEEIQKALDNPLKAGAFGGLPVVLENSTYVPDVSTPFLTGTILPAQPTQTELGPAGTDLHEGIYQISIYYPKDSGTGEMNRKADEISLVFKSGVTFEWETTCVRINNIGRNPLRINKGWAVLDLSAEWSSHVKRTP